MTKPLKALLIALVVLVILELVSHRHGHWGALDSWPSFYGVLGFLGATLMVFAARFLAPLLRRKDDHYDA